MDSSHRVLGGWIYHIKNQIQRKGAPKKMASRRNHPKIGYPRELIEIDGLSSFSPVNDGKVGVMNHGCNLCVSHLL